MDYPEDIEVPENWLRQKGQTINRSEYFELYQHLKILSTSLVLKL